MRLTLLAVAATVLLAACATSTPYGPAASAGGFGFSEQKIEEGKYRITFRGNSSTTREQVETFLLFRAAELTVQSGFDHFIVLESDTEASRRYSASPNPAFYGRYGFGRFPYYGGFPYYAYGWGWGYPFGYDYGFDAQEITRYSAIAFVNMGRGPKPANDPQAFDARDVMNNLRPAVIPASPQS